MRTVNDKPKKTNYTAALLIGARRRRQWRVGRQMAWHPWMKEQGAGGRGQGNSPRPIRLCELPKAQRANYTIALLISAITATEWEADGELKRSRRGRVASVEETARGGAASGELTFHALSSTPMLVLPVRKRRCVERLGSPQHPVFSVLHTGLRGFAVLCLGVRLRVRLWLRSGAVRTALSTVLLAPHATHPQPPALSQPMALHTDPLRARCNTSPRALHAGKYAQHVETF